MMNVLLSEKSPILFVGFEQWMRFLSRVAVVDVEGHQLAGLSKCNVEPVFGIPSAGTYVEERVIV